MRKMLTLGIETTGEICSIAICEGSSLKAMLLSHTYRDLLVRLPHLTKIVLEAANCTLHDISLISVSVGPGSFMSTRIGVAYAKALAYSLNKPIIGVRTLECMAHLAPSSDGQTVVVLYPSRPTRLYEAYSATFMNRGGNLEMTEGESVIDVEAKIKGLANSKAPTIICSPFRDEWRKLLERIPHANLLFVAHIIPTAEGIARLAYNRWEREQRGDEILSLKPLYVLPSQAEERFGIRLN